MTILLRAVDADAHSAKMGAREFSCGLHGGKESFRIRGREAGVDGHEPVISLVFV
jgi:hypothetical protein